MAKKKARYHYISGMYNITKDGEKKETNSTTFVCATNESDNPSGIPTMGYMTKCCRKHAEESGYEYVEDSFFILSIIELTKEQYDALNDTVEPED